MTLGLRRPVIRPLPLLVAAAAIAAGTYVAGPAFGRHDETAAQSGGPKPGQSTPLINPPALAAPGDAAGAGPIGGSNAAVGSVAQLTKSIGIWSANVVRNDKDFISAENLALLYHARGRLTANLDDYQRALDAARLAQRMNPGDETGRALEATVLAGLHDFSGALRVASALYASDPGQVGALATAGDAQLELGDLAAAGSTYAKVASLTKGPAVDARLARIAYLTGDPSRALKLARQARDEAVAGLDDGDTSTSDLVFYHFQLGEMARLTGATSLARTEYAAALAVRPDDLGSLVGLARVDAATGRVDEALAGLRHAAGIAPQPDTLALMGDLLAARGDRHGADEQYATVRAIRTLSELAGSVYDRQLLLFELDHGGATPGILDRARAALVDRHDAYGHDVVAWALYRLGRAAEAQTEIDAARASGIIDARIDAHAGAIAIALGDVARGRELLRQALAAGPALDPLQAAEARALLAAN